MTYNVPPNVFGGTLNLAQPSLPIGDIYSWIRLGFIFRVIRVMVRVTRLKARIRG